MTITSIESLRILLGTAQASCGTLNSNKGFLMERFLIIISVIFLSIFAFFFSNVKGYYRFKQYCEAQGGLRIYEPLERDVGWLAEDNYDAKYLAKLDGVGFVRYKDDNGDDQDIKYLRDGHNDASYTVNASDSSYPTNYIWRRRWEFVDEGKRIKKLV